MYPDAKHKNELEIGESYQDKIAKFIMDVYGYAIEYYKTKKEQYEIGESKQGFEIKLDTQLRKYGHLSIEVAEKSRKDIPNWTPSGILRKDNTKFYIQGDDQTAWCFIKEKLIKYYNENKPEVIEKHGTIKTFYINMETANKLASRILNMFDDTDTTRAA